MDCGIFGVPTLASRLDPRGVLGSKFVFAELEVIRFARKVASVPAVATGLARKTCVGPRARLQSILPLS